ncbi:MAG: hypothetical protein ABW252_10695 [Polyangiales bacterium]
MHRDVVIVGYRLNAKEPAPKALERILGLAPEVARKVARSFPAVVGAALSEHEATQLAARLRDAGAQVEVRELAREGARPEQAVAAAPMPAPLPAARMPPPPAAARMPPPPPPPPPAARAALDEVDDDALEAGTVTAAYRLGDFGLAPSAPKPAAPAPPASPQPPKQAPQQRAPGEDLSFDLDFSAGPDLELEHAANSNARAPTHSDPPDFDDRFELSHDAPPAAAAPAVEERAYRAVQQRAPRTSVHAPRRSSPLPAPVSRGRGARALSYAQGWLPSLVLLALLSLGTLVAVGYALDPEHAFALLSPRPARAPEAEPIDDARHPLLREAPASLRGPLAAILRARIAGVHALPTTFTGRAGKTIECVLVEQRTPDEDVRARLDALRSTGSEVPPPAGADAALREHARMLRAASGTNLSLTPLCLAP